MAGHSKWKQIKHKKSATDQKRSRLFSKLLKAISVAARQESNPQFNPRLRTTIEKARAGNVPQDNIDRAVNKALENKDLEDLIIEAYGPGGSALLISAITDNGNRTVSEIKKILNDAGAKFAEPGSVRWAFEASIPEQTEWQAKFKQEIGAEDKIKLEILIQELESRDDTQKVYTNT